MKKSKIIINSAGYIIIILSLIFIVNTIRKIDLTIVMQKINPSFLLLLLPLGLLYGAVFVLLAFNFCLIMRILHKENTLNFRIIPHYLKANLGKYLPLNIFHFAGRHLLLADMGYDNKKILLSNITEFIILISISCVFLVSGLLSGIIILPHQAVEALTQNRFLFITGGIILCAGCFIILIKFKLKRIKSIIRSLLSGFSLSSSLGLYASYSAFFVFTGASLYIILIQFSGHGFSLDNLFYVICSFAVCWLIGFVSPGVPGGIGIREALLIFFLSPLYGEAGAIYSSIVLRLITISGDIIAFLYAILMNKILQNNRVSA